MLLTSIVLNVQASELTRGALGAGSMFETRKRWRVPYLLYLLAAIMIAEIAFNGESLACIS